MACGLAWLITRILDERHGKHLGSLQVLLNPLMIRRKQLAEAEQRWRAWFLRVCGVGFSLRVIALLSMAFGRRNRGVP